MINYDLSKIRALIFDVDGVLSESNVLLLGAQPILRMVTPFNTQ